MVEVRINIDVMGRRLFNAGDACPEGDFIKLFERNGFIKMSHTKPPEDKALHKPPETKIIKPTEVKRADSKFGRSQRISRSSKSS